MGYMGFGMKKEVYTRKPKKFFSTLKGTYREKKQGDNKDPKVSLAELRAARNNRFKHFYQTILFKAVVILGIITFISFVSWGVYFEPIYFNYKQALYEKEEINQYVKSKRSDLDLIHDFFQKRSNKILSLAPKYYKDLKLVISSPNLNREQPSDSIHIVYSPSSWEIENHSILNDGLTVSREGFIIKTYLSNWIYNIDLEEKKVLNNSIIEYLESSKKELLSILNIIKRNKWNVDNTSKQTQITYEHPEFGDYQIIFATNKPKSRITDYYGEKRYTEIGTIKESEIFWIKWKVRD